MPRALSSAVRQAIGNRSRHNQSPGMIASEMGLHERTVRRIVDALEHRGKTALQAEYTSCGIVRSEQFSQLRQQILALRRQHPQWGAGRLLLELEENYPKTIDLPCERTLQRWLREEFRSPAPAGRPVREHLPRAARPHQVWQVDACEQKRLGNGQMFSWLRVADECSGAVLKTVVFSRRTFSASASAAGPASLPPDIPGMGTSDDVAGRQRSSLGIVQRPASNPGAVAHRSGD
jgi:hypothetical protein